MPNFFNKYPYTDFHELNLDWILQTIKDQVAAWEEFHTTMTGEWTDMQEDWHDTKEAWISLKNYVENYFATLDLQAEVNTKIDEMVADGTMDQIIIPYFNTYKTEINQMILNQNNRITVLEGRMDSFTHLAEGSTTGDAELIDARVGANGYTYASAGDAIRGQIDDVNDRIDDIADESVYTIDHIYLINARVDNTGTIVSSANYVLNNDMIPIEMVKDLILTPQTGITNYLIEYDNTGTWIQSETFASITLWNNLPDTVKFVRFEIYKSGGATIAEYKSVYSYVINTGLNIRLEALEGKTYNLIHAANTNYVNTGNVSYNKYVQGDAVNQGSLGNSSSYIATDYIEVDENNTYYHDNMYLHYFAFYDENKAYISGGGDTLINLPNPFHPPTGAKYFRGSISASTDLSTVYIYTSRFMPAAFDMAPEYANHVALTTPCDYDGKEVSLYRKVLCIGDSFTEGAFNAINQNGQDVMINPGAGYTYPQQFTKMFGCQTVNKGTGGATVESWFATHASENLSGYDCAIVMLGINNALIDPTWTTSMEDAFINIINKIKNENTGIKIYICTPPANGMYGESIMRYIAQGMRDMVAGLADDDVILVDLIRFCHLQDHIGYRCGHLSALGYWRLAKDIGNCISYIMSGSLDNYRNVQFTGTSYYWNRSY